MIRASAPPPPLCICPTDGPSISAPTRITEEVQGAFPPVWIQRLTLAPVAWLARKRGLARPVPHPARDRLGVETLELGEGVGPALGVAGAGLLVG